MGSYYSSPYKGLILFFFLFSSIVLENGRSKSCLSDFFFPLFIYFLRPHLLHSGSRWVLTLSQLSWGEGGATRWTSRQFTAGPHRKTTNNHLQSLPSIHTHTWNMHTCKHHTGKQQAWFCSIYSFIYLFIHPQKMDSHFGHSEANTPTVTAFHHVHREAFKAHTDQMRTFPQKICRGRALH